MNESNEDGPSNEASDLPVAAGMNHHAATSAVNDIAGAPAVATAATFQASLTPPPSTTAMSMISPEESLPAPVSDTPAPPLWANSSSAAVHAVGRNLELQTMAGRQGRIQIRLDPRRATAADFAGRFPIRATVNGRTHAVRVNFNRQHQRPYPNNPHNNNNNNNNRSGMPRLQPQVLPDSKQDFHEKTINDNDIDDDLLCSICYEMMNDPSGCGNCSARFCFSCLKRVTELAMLQQRQTPGTTGPPMPPRCPVCRAEIAHPDDIARDPNLRQRIELLPPVPCRYQGCQARVRIHQISIHETICPHVKMNCRFHTFGCPWSGKRLELHRHELEECHLARVSELVERYREMQMRLAHLHQSVMANGNTLEFQRIQRQRESNQLSTGNIFHLIQFVHMITCCTPRFLVVKDAWAAFHADPKGRATVANFCILLPSILLILGTLASSYRQMLAMAASLDLNNLSHEADEILFAFADGVLYTLILACLAIIIGLCFFSECLDPAVWQRLPIPLPSFLGGSRRFGDTHILQYAVTFALTFSHAIAFEQTANTLRATLLWIWLCITSAVFPALISFMSLATNQFPNAVNDQTTQVILQTGRAVRPLWFALCYAPCLVFGLLPCMDAAVLLFLGRDAIKQVSVVERALQVGEGQAFGNLLKQIPTRALYLYIGVRLGMRARELEEVAWIRSFDFVAVCCLVLSTKMVLWKNSNAGIQFGYYILSQARARSNSRALRTETSGHGVVILSVWCLLLGAIVIT
jgi:hypothetical protein